jgi:hypothetical protein
MNWNTLDYCENCLHNPCDCKLIVSNCTNFSNRKFIIPYFDGISAVVTQYQVVDKLGQFWFQDTKDRMRGRDSKAYVWDNEDKELIDCIFYGIGDC